MLLAQFLLRVAQMGLGLVGYHGPSGADLALDRGNCLACRFSYRAGHAGQVWSFGGAAAELLDARGHLPLMGFGLAEVLLKPLLVGGLLGQRDVRREVGLQLRLLGVGLVEPLDQLRVTRVQVVLISH